MTLPLFIFEIQDEFETRRLAGDIAAVLAAGDVVALSGDLGAGKSAFARAALRALAGDETLEVPSPTFTLVQSYDFPRLAVAHFDLYRMADPSELAEIGFDAAIRGGAALVEWPERAAAELPADSLVVAIAAGGGPDERRISLYGPETWRSRLQRSFDIRKVLEENGFSGCSRTRMAGDASSRRYERVRGQAGSAVLMDWPRAVRGPDLEPGRTYAEIVHVQTEPVAFIGVAEILRAGGLRAPEVIAADCAKGLILMEDFGKEGLLDESGEPIAERFVAAARAVAEKDIRHLPRQVDTAFGSWTVPDFDRSALRTELSLFPAWYHGYVAGRDASAEEVEAFEAATAPIVERMLALPRGLLLRDVIAPNLAWLGGDRPEQQVGFLDFQDAMVGPAGYDIVSLVTDVRRDIPSDLAEAMIEAYLETLAAGGHALDRGAFEEAFAVVSAQRNLKILGGFARLFVRDGRPDYLKHLPRAAARVEAALAHPVLAPARLWYERWKRTTGGGAR